MRESDAFEDKSQYVKAADVDPAKWVRIKTVRYEPIGKDKEMRAVCFFEKATKGLILNRTNFRTIARITGADDTDAWPGKVIELFQSMTDYAGETVPCVRVRAPGAQHGLGNAPRDDAPPPPRPAPPRVERDDPRTTAFAGALDDEIPF